MYLFLITSFAALFSDWMRFFIAHDVRLNFVLVLFLPVGTQNKRQFLNLMHWIYFKVYTQKVPRFSCFCLESIRAETCSKSAVEFLHTRTQQVKMWFYKLNNNTVSCNVGTCSMVGELSVGNFVQYFCEGWGSA